MLLRNHPPPSPPLMTSATRKVVPLIRIKVKGIGRRTGEKPTQEKGSLHFLSSILTGWVSLLYKFIRAFL